jgi:hypothetical protein
MDKNNEAAKTNGMQELSVDDMNRVSGGKKVHFQEVCTVCGRYKDNPEIPEDQRCHCGGKLF